MRLIFLFTHNFSSFMLKFYPSCCNRSPVGTIDEVITLDDSFKLSFTSAARAINTGCSLGKCRVAV